jgi:hypothetical protein
VAIFGNLTEFPFVEVLAMLEARTGILHFASAGLYKALELHLEQGQLRGFRVDGRTVRDGFEVRSYLLELSALKRGEFVFERKRAEELLNDHAFPVRGAVFQDAPRQAEIDQYREYLPEPGTVFTVADESVTWLEDELRDFWERSRLLLARHASAQEISSSLRLDVAWVQLALYKLRVAGLVRPTRRIVDAPNLPIPNLQVPTRDTLATTNVVPAQRQGLVSRLLGALGRLRRAS